MGIRGKNYTLNGGRKRGTARELIEGVRGRTKGKGAAFLKQQNTRTGTRRRDPSEEDPLGKRRDERMSGWNPSITGGGQNRKGGDPGQAPDKVEPRGRKREEKKKKKRGWFHGDTHVTKSSA